MTPTDSDLLSIFFSWLARSSVQTCVLICMILAVQGIFRNKLSPCWRHGLWLLVLVRLALPWAPESALSVYNLYSLVKSDSGPAAEEEALDDLAGPERIAVEGPKGGPLSEGVYHQPPWKEANPAGVPAIRESHGWNNFKRILPWVWLVGALAVILGVLVESFSLAAAIRSRRFVTDQSALDLLEDCKEELRMHSYLAVVETPRVKSPALFGFLRPRLLLPEGTVESLGRDRLRHVFLHELSHLKRHDIAINWAMAALQALHWFNPLVWYAFYRMRADRELACDASVLCTFNRRRDHDTA